MTEKAVQIWFQNKRQAVKRQRIATSKSTTIIQTVSPPSPPLDVHATPLASRVKADILRDGSSCSRSSSSSPLENTPPRPHHSLNRRSSTPSIKRSQALTFHLNPQKKTLTPVKTSPNSRVNKLINSIDHSPSKAKRPVSNPSGSLKGRENSDSRSSINNRWRILIRTLSVVDLISSHYLFANSFPYTAFIHIIVHFSPSIYHKIYNCFLITLRFLKDFYNTSFNFTCSQNKVQFHRWYFLTPVEWC